MIIFFHGFASVGDSFKSRELRKAFPDQIIAAPDLPTDPALIVPLVRDLITTATDKVIFVGTSLGGFYANYCAQYFDAPCVIANPSIKPSVTIGARKGENKNITTGATFHVTQSHIDTFKEMEAYLAENTTGSLINLFLAQDDTVLDYKKTLEAIPFRRSLNVFPDGGHRFEEHWDEVIRVIDNVMKID